MLADTKCCAKGEGGGEHVNPYSVGTLTYTKASMLALMLWLLWGDFCFMIMEVVVPGVMPLTLRTLDAPNWLIGMFLVTIPNIFNATVCPAVSFRSDRHRSPHGRRIPFLRFATPFLALFLALIGGAPHLAAWATRIGLFTNERIVTLVMIGVFIVGFQFFNMIVASVYYYLFNDVVPQQYLGRFLGVFRFVGIIAQSTFYFFIFPHAESHSAIIFCGAAVLYLVAFSLMCKNVKEGEYPPPEDAPATVRAGVRIYIKECFSNRFYWLFYISYSLWAASLTIGVFVVFFAKSVGLSLAQYGAYSGTVSLIAAVLLIPCGYLADRIHPLRTMRIAVTALAFVGILPLVFLFFPVPKHLAFPVWCVVFGAAIPFLALYTASELPAFMRLLPKDRYGQFSSAASLVRSLAALTGGLLGGLMIDWARGWNSDPDVGYRYIPFWYVTLQGLSATGLWLLYREWQKLGGDKSYVPPDV